MEYILTTVLFVLGVCFHVMQKIRALRKEFPQFGFRKIWITFVIEEWDSLFISFFVWLAYELSIFILHYYKIKMPDWFLYYGGEFALALVLGYAGQRIAYKYLGTAEDVLNRKISSASPAPEEKPPGNNNSNQ